MIYSLTLLLQAIIFFITLKIFTKTKGLTLIESLFFLLLVLNNVFVMQYLGNIALLTNILLLFCIVYTRNKEWMYALSTVSIVMIVNILADHIATFILSLMFQIHILESMTSDIMFYLLLSFIFALGIIVLTRKFFESNAQFLTSKKGRKPFTLATVSILFVFYLNVVFELVSGNQKNIVELNLLFFAIILLVSGITIASYIQSIRRTYETEQQKLEFEMMRTYTNNLEQQYSEIRKFRHDYQNILTSLEGYILKKDYTNLENYFFENIKPTGKQIQQNNFVLKDLSKMKLEDIKSLIAAKASVAQEKNIKVVIEVTEPIDFINISSVTLIRALGIILDNAIEATETIENKRLSIAFIKNKNSIHIVVENTCLDDLPKLHVLKKEGYSTKGPDRGLGLSNLQELINSSSNSTLITKIENTSFSQTITILND